MAQKFKLVIAALILCIGIASSRPLKDAKKIEKRSTAETILGDLTADQSGIINANDGM